MQLNYAYLIAAMAAALFALAWPAIKDQMYLTHDWKRPMKVLSGVLHEELGMAYLGQKMMGQGTPIPIVQQGPNAGQIDINALVGMLVDQRKDYVYDTLNFAPGSTVQSAPYRMFQVPIGGQDPYNNNAVKTELETNMRSAGQFSAPYDFILNNLGFYIVAGAELFDITTLMNTAWFQFTILGKVQWMGHLQRHPSGMGITGMSTVTAQQNWLNGLADPKAIWWFGDWKKYIPPLTNFQLQLQFPESYSQLYNASTTSSGNLPAGVRAKIFDSGLLSATTSLPTFLSQALGGNGLKLICLMNGISNGPVQ